MFGWGDTFCKLLTLPLSRSICCLCSDSEIGDVILGCVDAPGAYPTDGLSSTVEEKI